LRLTVTAFGTAAVWIPVMYLTRPESDATLDAFYRRVRPGGAGWGVVRTRTGLEPVTLLRHDISRTVAAAAALFGGMFAIGGAMLAEPGLAVGSAALLVAGLVGLRTLGERRVADGPAQQEL
nr:hypothetical protein [Candidatus Palauibacterales bacterium]